MHALIGGVYVSVSSAAEARHTLVEHLKRKLNTSLVLTDGAHAVRRTRRDLGMQLDIGRMLHAAVRKPHVPLMFSVDTRSLQRSLRVLQPIFAGLPRNAAVVDQQGAVRIIPARPGERLNVPRTAQWLTRLIYFHPSKTVLPVRVIYSSPRVPTAALSGITGKLSQFSTTYFPHGPRSENRNHNMLLSAWAIDGAVLKRGAVFSFDRMVGERTADRGFRSGVMYEQGEAIEGIGAGISQTAGTLCNAALFAGLQMLEFRTHSHPVAYIPVGRDGTVAAGSFDMRFRNNTGYPILIRCRAYGDRLTATIYGHRQPGRSVDLTVVKYPLGPGRLKTVLYRTIRSKGAVVSKERIGSSDYRWEIPPQKPSQKPHFKRG